MCRVVVDKNYTKWPQHKSFTESQESKYRRPALLDLVQIFARGRVHHRIPEFSLHKTMDRMLVGIESHGTSQNSRRWISQTFTECTAPNRTIRHGILCIKSHGTSQNFLHQISQNPREISLKCTQTRNVVHGIPYRWHFTGYTRMNGIDSGISWV